MQWSETIFQTCNNLSYRLIRRYNAPWIKQGRVQSTHSQKDHVSSAWDLNCVFREKSWIWIPHLWWENRILCPKFIYSRTGEKQGERPETWFYSLPFGQTAQSAGAQENQPANAPFSSSRFPTDAEDEPQISPDLESPSPWSRATFTALCPSLHLRTAQSLRACWNCEICFEDTVSACSTGLHTSNSQDS